MDVVFSFKFLGFMTRRGKCAFANLPFFPWSRCSFKGSFPFLSVICLKSSTVEGLKKNYIFQSLIPE